MSTLLLEVDAEQEKALEKLLQYMNIHFQKLPPTDDFWDSLSPGAKARIEQGKADAEAGRYMPARQVIEQKLT